MSAHGGHDNSGAHERNESESEYQDLLKVSSSMITGMQKQLDAFTNSHVRLTASEAKFVEKLKEGVGQLTDQQSVNVKLNQVTKQRDYFLNKAKITQNSMYSDLAEELDLQRQVLNTFNKRVTAIEGVKQAADTLAGSINGVFDGFTHGLHHIPLIGGMLSNIAHGPVEALKSSITGAAGEFATGFGKAIMSGKTGMQALSIAGSGAMKFLAAAVNPVVLAVAAIGMAIGAAFMRFHELEKAATDFKVTTGLAGQNLHDIESTIHHAQMNMVDMGISASDMSKAMSDFTNQFSDLSIPAESTAMSVALMVKQFGVFGPEVADVNKLFQNMGGLSEQQAQYLAGSVVEMANLAHVAPDTVIKDMSQNSAEIMKYTRGNVQEMAKAAVQAAKMGTSLKEAASVSEKLLDFEDSITKELELSALAGTDLNFARARELAFTGDILGAQQEVTKQLDQMGDLSKLDAITKRQITEATGMEIDSLINQQRIKKQFGTLDKERLAAANALIDAGIDINDVGDEELESQVKRMKNQESMQDMMSKIGNKMGAIGTAFSDMLAPIAGPIINGILLIVDVVSSVLVPVLKGIGTVLKYAFMPITWAFTKMQQFVDLVKQHADVAAVLFGVYEAIRIAQGKSVIAAAAQAMWAGVTFLYEQRTLLTKPLMAAWEASIAAIKKRGLIMGIAEMAINAAKAVAGIPVIGPLLMAAAAAGAFALGMGYFSKAGDLESLADGKTRVSTKEGGLFELSPNDDLVAAPGLGDAMAGGGGTTELGTTQQGGGNSAIAGLVNSMITEIRGLRTDLASGKVAVYMDGRLVTAQVASAASRNPVTS
jgi:hypothetical protein